MRRFLFIAALLLFCAPSHAHAAVAFVASTTNHTASASSATYSFNAGAASDRVLFACFTANKSVIPSITSVTYGGVAMTASSFSPQSLPTDTTVKVYLYYLLNPASGSNNVVITFSGSLDEINSNAVAYSGVGSVEQDVHVNGTGTSGTLTPTTINNNSWIVGCFRNNNSGDGAAGANTTKRSNVAGQVGFYDRGPVSPAGAYSIISTFGSTQYGGIGMAMSPVVAPVTTPAALFQTFWW